MFTFGYVDTEVAGSAFEQVGYFVCFYLAWPLILGFSAGN
jgi:hypothetical protein